MLVTAWVWHALNEGYLLHLDITALKYRFFLFYNILNMYLLLLFYYYIHIKTIFIVIFIIVFNYIYYNSIHALQQYTNY